MMFDVGKLYSVAPPPKQPSGAGSDVMWLELENKLGFKFPEDYKALCLTYGAGTFADFFGIMNPFYQSSRYTPYMRWLDLRLGGMRDAKNEYPEEAHKFAIYPEVGGVFPWGYTDNGGTMCWLTQGNPDDWTIVCFDGAYSNKYDLFKLSLSEFVEKWLTNKLVAPALRQRAFSKVLRSVFSPAR